MAVNAKVTWRQELLCEAINSSRHRFNALRTNKSRASRHCAAIAYLEVCLLWGSCVLGHEAKCELHGTPEPLLASPSSAHPKAVSLRRPDDIFAFIVMDTDPGRDHKALRPLGHNGYMLIRQGADELLI